MASISCSVILMISCFRTVREKNPLIYLLGNFPRDKRALLRPSGIPYGLLVKDILLLSFNALCKRNKPTLHLILFGICRTKDYLLSKPIQEL